MSLSGGIGITVGELLTRIVAAAMDADWQADASVNPSDTRSTQPSAARSNLAELSELVRMARDLTSPERDTTVMQAAHRAVLARLRELAPVPAQLRRLPISRPSVEPSDD